MIRPSLYILAGGNSTRFGADKARVAIDGQPMLRHLARRLGGVTSHVTIVADRPDKYIDLQLRTIADESPGQGPLGGLVAALSDSARFDSPWIFLLACDSIGVRPEWVERLVGQLRADDAAVAFRTDHWHPTMALYHRDLLPEARRALAEGRGALHALLHRIGARAVVPPPDFSEAYQFNTPGELAAALPPRQNPARHTDDPLPPYAFLPGGTLPHPRRDPGGWLHGRPEAPVVPLPSDQWRRQREYLFGVDLFNLGYYWEAHELWEGLWRATSDRARKEFLHVLILLTAAMVKLKTGRARGVRILCGKARSKLQLLVCCATSDQCCMGVELSALWNTIDAVERAADDVDGAALRPLLALVQ